MTKRINLSISIPPEMAKKIHQACKREHRTRSELFREAIRLYLLRNDGNTAKKCERY